MEWGKIKKNSIASLSNRFEMCGYDLRFKKCKMAQNIQDLMYHKL